MKGVLQRIYDSEINFSISTFWDGGFDLTLGLDYEGNGGRFWKGHAKTFDEALIKLQTQALIMYPDSDFAKSFRNEPK